MQDTIIEDVELSRLQAMPEVLTRLIQELHNEKLNMTDLAELILQDSTLAMKVLAVANSSFYNRRTACDSVAQGINLLGLKMVKMIAVSAAMHQFLRECVELTPAAFTRFWHHALLTALIGKAIAQATGYPRPDEAYLAGLLHDIGQLALLASKGSSYRKLLDAYTEEESLIEQERRVFGITHGEAGALLAAYWRLQPLVIEAIRYHHAPVAQVFSATELVKLVNAANALAHLEATDNHPALVVTRNLFGLPAAEARRLREKAEAQMDIIAMVNAVDMQQTDERHRPAPADAARDRLQAEVHASAMLSLLQEALAPAGSEEELLTSLLQAAHLLFEPREAMLFAWDADTNLLSGRPVGTQDEALARIRLPLEGGRSLIADALLQNATTHGFDPAAIAAHSMTDQQLLAMTGAQGMYCVPLRNQHYVYGVLLLAYPAAAQQRAEARLRFIGGFARQAADALLALRNRQQQAALENALQEQAYRERARRIVHEANNPLAILRNYLSTLDHKLSDSQPVSKELQVLREEIDRVSGIIRKLAHPEEVATGPAATAIDGLLRDLVAVCDAAMFAPRNIRVELQAGERLPPVAADDRRLKQIFINLFKNAAEAMPDGGALRVSASRVIGGERQPSVLVSVTDSGLGMPPEVLARLFQPIETTKGSGNAGLGLSITAGLVAELGGRITCRSSPGAGTTFDVLLPCQREAA